jgi:hypothetical protein
MDAMFFKHKLSSKQSVNRPADVVISASCIQPTAHCLSALIAVTRP